MAKTPRTCTEKGVGTKFVRSPNQKTVAADIGRTPSGKTAADVLPRSQGGVGVRGYDMSATPRENFKHRGRYK